MSDPTLEESRHGLSLGLYGRSTGHLDEELASPLPGIRLRPVDRLSDPAVLAGHWITTRGHGDAPDAAPPWLDAVTCVAHLPLLVPLD